MKRLFTFGCSFTQWNWPTWADILAKNYDQFQNWGIAGTGNRAIAHRVSECVLKNTLTDQDTIVIQWTDYNRFDQHISGLFPNVSSWRLGGNIFLKNDYKYILDTWREDSYIYDALTLINLTDALLRKTPAQVFFVSRINMSDGIDKFPGLEFLKPVLQSDYWIGQPIQEVVSDLNYSGKKMLIKDAARFGIPVNRTEIDQHPLPRHYLAWLKQTFPNQQFDEEFVAHSESVLEGIKHYDEFNDSYERKMGWRIKGNYIKGY